MSTAPNLFKAFLSAKLNAGGSESTIQLDRITTVTGEIVTTADFADLGRGILTINPDGAEDNPPEFCSFVAVSGTTLTGVVRGLSAKSNTVVAANKRFHPVGTPVVISWGVHNILDLIEYIDDAAAGGLGTADRDTAGSTKLTEDLGTRARAMAALVTQQASPGMTLNVEAFGLGAFRFAGGNTGTITAPTVNPRIDLVVYNIFSAALAIRTGVEAGSPATPAPQSGDIPLCSVYNRVGETSIKDEDDSTNGYIDRWYFPSVNAGAVVYLTCGESITALDAVYLKASDQKVYKTDATGTSSTAPFVGFALESHTTDETVPVQVNGIVGGLSGLTAGTEYWLSGTAGAITASPSTNLLRVGQALSTTTLLMDPRPAIVPRTTIYSNIFGSSTTQFDITNPSGSTFRYTFDGTGTDPTINATTVPVGTVLVIAGQNFNAANNGTFVVINSGSNFFEVTNASGVAENDKTLGSGSIKYGYRKKDGVRYIEVELVGGGGNAVNGGGGNNAGSGAGSGGYSFKRIATPSLATTETLTIGGINGTTSFGSHCQATGGSNGTSNTTGALGGDPGVGSGGDYNESGQPGFPALRDQDAGGNRGGMGGGGGSSRMGRGGRGFYTSGANVDGQNATGYGSGGGGSYASTTSGAGTIGAIKITEYP